MPKTSVAVGVTIGAALAAGYDRVFLRAEDRVRALGKSLQEARKRQAAAEKVVQYRKKLQTLKRLQAEAGGESERFAGRIEKTRQALMRAIRQAEQYGIEVGSARDRRQGARRGRLPLRAGAPVPDGVRAGAGGPAQGTPVFHGDG